MSRRRDLVAASCPWCYLAEHGGNCKALWKRLIGERSVFPPGAVCPWCSSDVLQHLVGCPVARLVKVAPL